MLESNNLQPINKCISDKDSAHVTIRSSPLPLLLSTFALQSILPPFHLTCNQLYALKRAILVERAAPGHPARPHQLHIRCKGLRRSNVLLRGYQRLSVCTPAEYIRAPPGPARPVQCSTVQPSRTLESCPSITQNPPCSEIPVTWVL